MKKCVLTCIAICISILAHAQATDLVVDCQTPGWLSNKINYGDQQTVKNLKVTGYINATDLNFIGGLIDGQSLQEKVDLSDVNVVGNTLKANCFGISNLSNVNLKCLSLPKTVESLENILPYNGAALVLHIDTLYFNCNIKYMKGVMFGSQQFAEMPHTIIVGEKVDSIPNEAFDDRRELFTVKLPKTMKYIGDRAFYNCRINNVNFNELEKLEYLEMDHACDYKPDTLVIPHNLDKIFNFSAFAYRDGQHIFIYDNIEYFVGASKLPYSAGQRVEEKVHLHMKKQTPPQIMNYKRYATPFENSIIYVPKGTKAIYENSDWKYATIIEENPVETVTLSEHQITLNKEEQFTLSVSVTPEDADDKTIEWKSEDESITTVDANGVVTAIKEGETKIYAISMATGIQDFCSVLVRKNVTSISLEETQMSLANIGDTKQIVAVITPDDATDKSVTWKSSDENVCTISSTGLVTAIGPGTAVITATTVDGDHTATCVVKVLQHVTGLSLNKQMLSLKVQESEQLRATITPESADIKIVQWTSSDESVASVDGIGNVKALKAGEAWIKALSQDNEEAKDSCKVAVLQPVTGISLSINTCRLTNIGESIQLVATVQPADASNKDIKWTSSNDDVCVVANGNVVATGYGTAVVMAFTADGGFMASCIVTVEKESVPVTSIELSQTIVTLIKGETLQLTATAYPADATNKTLIWKSSNEVVCVTSQSGLLIAVGEGSAIVTVTPENGIGQAQCSVTVNNSVDAIKSVRIDLEDSPVYNMMGCRVTNLVKGRMYIRNGQQFIAR